MTTIRQREQRAAGTSVRILPVAVSGWRGAGNP
jgi:hypothetical protein